MVKTTTTTEANQASPSKHIVIKRRDRKLKFI